MAASLALRSVSTSLQVLPDLVNNLDNLDLRTQMMEASLLAGLAIASTKTTLSHSISYPITLRFGVLHGLACAFTIAQVLRFNAETDEGRIHETVRGLGFATADSLACCLEELLSRTGALEQLSSQIPSEGDLLTLAPRAITPGRADNNPRIATQEEIESIMAAALDRASRDVNESISRKSPAKVYPGGGDQA